MASHFVPHFSGYISVNLGRGCQVIFSWGLERAPDYMVKMHTYTKARGDMLKERLI